MKTLAPRLKTATVTRVQGADAKPSQGMYGWKWQKRREDFLRKHPLCVMCVKDDRAVPATVVDHIVPHQGNQALFWDESNWQPLCASHHSGEKQRQEREAGYR